MTRTGREMVTWERRDGDPIAGERHRVRGDCALDDADDNYEVVEERFPPSWEVQP